MVKYECFRCGYTNIIKTIFKNHLNRKFICIPKMKNITIQEINDYYFSNKKNIPAHKVTQTAHKVTQNEHKVTQNEHKVTQNYKCILCGKHFKFKNSLSRHKLKYCKKVKEQNDLKNLEKLVNLLNEQLKEQKREINYHKKELDKKDKQIEKLLKKTGISIGTQNIQNNIKILAYKNTDLSHLKDKDYIKFLSHSNFCVPHMIKKLHFDKKKPENHNIYISNLKNNHIMLYDGYKWNIRDRNEVINDMIEDNTNILEDKIEDWLETGKKYPQIMKKFNRYLEKKENDIVLDKIKQEIKFILYNNRTVVNEE